MNALISICIPTYNGEKYLEEALSSITCQTYKNFEVIIADNMSSDKTLSIAEKWAMNQTFPVHIFENPNIGIGKNWNFCIEKASGEYIKFLLQDDTLEENCLQVFLNAINYQNKIYDLIICKRNIIGDDTQYTREWKKNNTNLQIGLKPDKNGNYIIGDYFFKTPSFYIDCVNKFGEPTALFIKKGVFKRIGMYNEKMKQLLDVELYHRYLKVGKILIIDKKLVNFRVHENQATFGNLRHDENERKYYLNYTVPIKYFFFLPWKKIIKQALIK